ncbi:MAG: gamma-glutamyl-gamma-aminobutyrate hydrolase family protein [Dysgonamonadaceae bacterium]|jgi:microsomal dipeptidase-like Zn-dependent dipeptidase/gamma-glutamyl-gamma-aminobutyrate hydrolase PuuD|nr:gamma-glutamyl-gamma-aminobutyrate hydrolase family protein [Dysgonamonadaceae bacterium]
MKKIGFIVVALLSLLSQDIKSQEFYPVSKLNRITDSCFVDLRAKPQPLIGISASRTNSGGSSVSGTYIQAILKAGGMPIIIPTMTDGAVLRNIVKTLDGLVMTGGEDIHPFYYEEDTIPNINSIDSIRDIYDLTLLKLATDRNIPVLGVCRGEQAINVAFGGTLYQDIPTQYENKNSINHYQTEPQTEGTHPATIVGGTKLDEILNRQEIFVNSFHHQGVKNLAPHFRISARAGDGFTEAIEAYPNRSVLGVQFHPEGFVYGGDTAMLKIFTHIVKEAALFHQAKELHKRILSVDTHCDTPLEFWRSGFNIGNREDNQVNLPKMEEGMLDAAFFIGYIGQGPRDNASLQKAINKIDSLIRGIYAQVEANKDLCEIACTADDLVRIKNKGKKAIFLGIENGYGIGKDIANIARFQKSGVNYITLCHTKNNDICDSSSDTTAEWNGLSDFGRKVVKEMNRVGVLVDVSHVSEKTFFDVIALSGKPVIASHSSIRALCDHDRNLTDQQLQAIAKNGGVVQLCIVDEFVNPDAHKADLTDVIRHIEHAIRVAGIDHVGIASDFDGGGGVIGCNGSNDLINITVKLLEKNYSEEDIAKIWGGNFLRVLNEAQRK